MFKRYSGFRKLIVLLLLNFYAFTSLFAHDTIKIGVVSIGGETESTNFWSETADYLNKQLSHYHFEITPFSYNSIETAVNQKDIDLLICNPANYILYKDRYKLKNIATLQNIYQGKPYSVYGSVVFTKKENLTIIRLSNLIGKKIALVDPLSMGGYLLAKELLQKHGFDLDRDAKTLIYTQNQNEVINSVLYGQADVGIVRTGIIEKMIEQGIISVDDIKIIHPQTYPDFPFLISTDLIPEWSMATLPHFSDNMALEIAQQLHNFRKQEPENKSASNYAWTLPSDYSIVIEKLKAIHAPPYERLKVGLIENISKDWYFFLLIFSLAIVFTLFIVFSRYVQSQLHRQKDEEKEESILMARFKAGDIPFFSETKTFAAHCAQKKFELKSFWSWNYLQWALVVTFSYYFAVSFGLFFSIANTGNTAIWYAAGIAFFAVYSLGYRIWPSIFLGALLVSIFPIASDSISLSGLNQLLLATLNGLNNAMEAVVGVFIIRKFIGKKPLFSTIYSTVSFIMLVALLLSLVAAIIGTITFLFFSSHGFFYGMLLTWWLGDAVGLILIVPLILSWKKPKFSTSKTKHFSLLIIFVALLILVAFFVFQIGYQIAYLFVPLFIYFTFRFGRFTSLAMALILGLVSNFVVVYLNIYWLWDTPVEALFYVRLFMLILLLTILSVAAVLDEQLLAKERMHLYKKIIENSNDGIAILDPQGYYLEQNPAHKKLVGYSDEELKGQTPAIHLGKEVFKTIANDLAEKNQSVREWESFSKQATIPISLSAFSIFNEENEIICYAGIGTDITERKNAENILRKSEAEAWSLFEYSAIPIMIEDFSEVKIYLDKLIAAGLTDWDAYFEQNPKELGKISQMIKVIDINERMVDLYGKGSRNELLKGIVHFFTDESLMVFKKEIIALAKGDHTFTSEIQIQNFRGESLHSILSLSIPPLYRKKLDRVLVSFVDITENKRAEKIQQALLNISNTANEAIDLNETLHTIEAQLSAIIDTSNFFIALYNAEKDELNLPFIRDQYKMPENLSAEKTLTSLVIQEKTSLLFNQKEMEEMEKNGILKIESKIPKIWLGIPLKVKGEVIGAFVLQSYTNEHAFPERNKETLEIIGNQIALSIERKKAEEELIQALEKAQESDHIKSSFLASMSHELRTPLNAIIGFSSLIDMDMSQEQIIQFSAMIHKSGNNLLQIVDSIFEVSLIDEGEQKIVLAPYSLEILMNDIFQNISTRQKVLNKTGVKILMKNNSPIQQEIYTDGEKFKHIFIQLLNNSLKFTHSGTIEFGLDRMDDNQFYHFYVKDTGIGIQKEKLAYIFDRFRMGDDTHTRHYEGMGIGLFICKKLIEIQGGKIEVHSKENEGSYFSFYLPLQKNNQTT